LQNKCLALHSLQQFSSNISIHSKNTYIIPFTFEGIKFPVRLNFAINIIKSQGQLIKFWS